MSKVSLPVQWQECMSPLELNQQTLRQFSETLMDWTKCKHHIWLWVWPIRWPYSTPDRKWKPCHPCQHANRPAMTSTLNARPPTWHNTMETGQCLNFEKFITAQSIQVGRKLIAVLPCSNAQSQMSNLCLSPPSFNLSSSIWAVIPPHFRRGNRMLRLESTDVHQTT